MEGNDMMEMDSLQEALREFDKKGKNEVSPILDQFLCHIAKTGETLVQWSQFRNYFLFKLEKVMDDFRASAPEQRGPANPNVESVPFEDMKERILKIVNGYNGIPFTIQRLCELLTEPKRNYTGTDKFLRGVEKNVMVVSCVHPTSEKNGCSGLSRMNGVMLPGNTSAYTERKVNGPGTPRPLNRPKVSLSSSLATNGLPDSTDGTDSKHLPPGQDSDKDSSEVSGSCDHPGSSVKNKHDEEEEEDMEAEHHEVKRLKFNKEEEEEEDDDEDEEEEVDTIRPSLPDSEEAEAMVQEKDEDPEDSEASSSALATADDQEPTSTQAEVSAGPGQEAEQPDEEAPSGSQEEASDMDQSEQPAPPGDLEVPESSREGEEAGGEAVSSSSSTKSSSSSSSSSSEERTAPVGEDSAPAPTSSTPEPPAEGASESEGSNTGAGEEPMEQD